MAKKFFTDESLQTFVDEIKSYTDAAVDDNKRMLVTFTADSDGTITADKTIAEILEAYANGVCVNGFYLNAIFALDSVGNNKPLFGCYSAVWSGTTCYARFHRSILMSDDSTISYDQKIYQGDYYTTTKVDTLLAAKADADHNHDDVYYTETEIDELLSNKKDLDFVVTITGNSTDGWTSDKTATEIYEAYSNGRHVYARSTSNSIYELTQCASSFANFSCFNTLTNNTMLFMVTNSATSLITNYYYTETEMDTKLASKADSSHNHDDTYDAIGAADEALASAKEYADEAAATIKNDLLNGAGEAYDTLKELGDLINENTDALDALETVAAGKADAEHTHDDRYYTIEQIDAYEFITTDDIDTICGAEAFSYDNDGNVAVLSIYSDSTITYDDDGNVVIS